MPNALPATIGTPSSILTDGDIERAIGAGYLLEASAYDKAQVKYSSYELRIGGYRLLDFSAAGERYTTPTDRTPQTVVLKPGETAQVFCVEQLSIPPNVLGRVTTVGQIFSSGLAAETTFADPGYEGELYVTLSNISTKILSLPYGKPLARLEFYKLGSNVMRPHKGSAARREPWVTWETPACLSAADFAGEDRAHWLQRLGTFDDGERYDERHSIGAHLLTELCAELAPLKHRQDLQAVAIYVIGSVLVVGAVALAVRALPPDVGTQLVKWLVPTACGVVLTTVLFGLKRFREALLRAVRGEPGA
jgi:deoxycytidine triphosphate deaminase